MPTPEKNFLHSENVIPPEEHPTAELEIPLADRPTGDLAGDNEKKATPTFAYTTAEKEMVTDPYAEVHAEGITNIQQAAEERVWTPPVDATPEFIKRNSSYELSRPDLWPDSWTGKFDEIVQYILEHGQEYVLSVEMPEKARAEYQGRIEEIRFKVQLERADTM